MNVAALNDPSANAAVGGSTVFLRVTRRVFLHIFVSDCGTGSLLISIDDTFAPFSILVPVLNPPHTWYIHVEDVFSPCRT